MYGVDYRTREESDRFINALESEKHFKKHREKEAMVQDNKHYNYIRKRDNYLRALNSGMFWKYYPELSGDWEKDKLIIDGVENGN